MTNGGTVGGQLWITIGGVGYLRGSNSEGFSSWYKLWSSKDTLFTAFSSTADADGETLSITVGGVTKTLTLDAAGVNQGGIITTGSQTIAGTKTFNNTPVIRGTDPAVFFRPDSTARQMSGIQNYIGEDDTKITESYIRLLQYSYTTGTKTALTYYETYKLPPVDESRTKNATYEIFTSKKYDTLDGRYLKLTGGTLSGNILVDKTGSTNNTSISVQNDNGKVTLYTSTNRGLYDNTSGRWIIYTLNSDGTNRIEASLLPGSASTLDLGSTSYPFNKVYANTVTCSRIIATATTDASETKATNVALTLGDTSGTHLILDGNEIIAKNGATAMGTLYLYGSTVEAGGGVFKATKGLAINTLSYGTDEGEITDPVTGQIYLKYV